MPSRLLNCLFFVLIFVDNVCLHAVMPVEKPYDGADAVADLARLRGRVPHTPDDLSQDVAHHTLCLKRPCGKRTLLDDLTPSSDNVNMAHHLPKGEYDRLTRARFQTIFADVEEYGFVDTMKRHSFGLMTEAHWSKFWTILHSLTFIVVSTFLFYVFCIALKYVYQLLRFIYNWLTFESDDVRTRKLHRYRIKPLYEPTILRNAFNSSVMPTFPSKVGHTHGPSEADRSAVSLFIDRFAQLHGLNAYYVQRSLNDEKHGRAGSRTYHWAKDITVAPARFKLPSRPLVAIVDVDQYLDMNEFLIENVHPTIIYTVQPDQVSKVEKNYSYTFDAANVLHYNVTGGASYTQRIWNYAIDSFTIIRTVNGRVVKVASYLVERKRAASDHEIILLVPTGTWKAPNRLLCALGCFNPARLHQMYIRDRYLDYLRVNTSSGFTRLISSSTEGLMVSTGKPGTYTSACIPVSVDDSLAALARTNQYPLGLPNVMAFVDGDRVKAIPLLEYHLSQTIYTPAIVCPVSKAVRCYQFEPLTYDYCAKASLTAFMSPLLHGAFSPSMTVANEEECIRSRVLDVRPLDDLILTPFLADVMKEFAAMVIPDREANTLHPTDHDEVLRRQARPAQRALEARSHGTLPRRIVRMFVKKEAYPNVKPPRAISTINAADKREYSRYMYAFERVLKSQPWYAFSKTPKQIQQRVVEVLAHATSAANTDFSKFDGHGSAIMRELEKLLLVRAFSHEHIEQLLQLHSGQYKLKAYGTLDSTYTTEFSRASGSPETSLFNTIVNAFVAYLARRMSKRDGLPIGPVESFQTLGIYGGDDGLTADISPTVYQNAAKTIGQELTIEPVLRGCIGIKFLARIYSPQVWFGDTANMCDIPRQLAKLHVCVRMNNNVTPVMKLLEKVRSFSLTDLNTPIIGDYCKAVIRENCGQPEMNELTAPIRSWLSRYRSVDQYDNTSAQWMLDEAQRVLPQFNYKRFIIWCNTCTTIQSLMQPPMFMPPPPAVSRIPVIVDNELPYGVPYHRDVPATPVDRAHTTNITDPVRITGTPKRNTITREFKVSLDPSPELLTLSEEKQLAINPPIIPDPNPPKIDTTPAISAEPPKIKVVTFAPGTNFETFKANKVLQGTWVDKPQRAKLTKQEFLKLKAEKIAAGTWTVKTARPSTSPIDKNWRTNRVAPDNPAWRRK